MYESFYFFNHLLEFCVLIPTIINIHRTSHKSTQMISLLSLFSYTILNLMESPKLDQNKVEYDLLILLLYSIVMFLLVIFSLIFSNNNFGVIERTVNEEMYIYDREFKRYGFAVNEYKDILMKKGTIKRANNTEILFSKEGEEVLKVFLFIKIPDNALITLKKQGVVIYSVDESSWIGSVECVRNYMEKDKNAWDCEIKVINRENTEVTWIEWEKNYFIKFIRKHLNEKLGTQFLFMWGNYMCVINKKLNDYVMQMKDL